MERDINLDEISDGKLYETNDLDVYKRQYHARAVGL